MQYLLIGGSGTLGHAVLKRLLSDGIPEENITIFSRDEQKHQTMRAVMPNLNYMLGDVRDAARVREATYKQDIVFHMAALKHVDLIERNVDEAIKTNILGTMNVAEACKENLVEHCIFSSTDKGVLAINAYGGTKFVAEKYLLDLNNKRSFTHFSVFRWGNVCGSRGSVIPLWIRQIKAGQPVTLTDERMTRFWINIDTAAKFMTDCYPNRPDKVLVPKMGAAKLTKVIAVLEGMLSTKADIKIVGVRPGEKIDECVESEHEGCINSNDPEIQLSAEELMTLLEPVVDEFN